MLNYLIKGFTLGLALSGTCLVTCGPIYAPYILQNEDRNLWKSFLIVMEISLGRFITYALFGAAAGFVGTQLTASVKTLFTGYSYILLSLFLLIYTFRQNRKKKCPVKKWHKFTEYPIILGLVTGISFCPSFLMALTAAFKKSGVISGMLFFIAFFVGTTIILIPLSLLGVLTKINKKIFRYIGTAAAVIIAVWFTHDGIKILKNHYFPEEVAVINFLESGKLNIIGTENEYLALSSLQNALKSVSTDSSEVFTLDDDVFINDLFQMNNSSFLLVTSGFYKKNIEFQQIFADLKEEKHFNILIIDSPDTFDNVENFTISIISKLDYFRFKNRGNGMIFNISSEDVHNHMDR